MKKFLILLTLIAVLSCSKDKPEDPLILPPRFEEMPDIVDNKNDAEEKKTPAPKQENKDVEDLKEILLQ
jgi:hypothetical protein